MKYSNESSVAYCSFDFPEELRNDDIPEYQYGYRLIGERLVPLSLLRRIESHMDDVTLDALSVFSAEQMVGEVFWKGLNVVEQEVLPVCLLLLIDEGRITFALPE